MLFYSRHKENLNVRQDAEGQIEQLENLLAGLKRRAERQEHRQNPS